MVGLSQTGSEEHSFGGAAVVCGKWEDLHDGRDWIHLSTTFYGLTVMVVMTVLRASECNGSSSLPPYGALETSLVADPFLRFTPPTQFMRIAFQESPLRLSRCRS